MVIFLSVVCTLGQKHPKDINFAKNSFLHVLEIKQHRFVKTIRKKFLAKINFQNTKYKIKCNFNENINIF